MIIRCLGACRPRLGWGGDLAWVVVVATLLPLLAVQGKAAETMDQAIGRFSNHLLLLWQKDPELSKVPPPQIIAIFVVVDQLRPLYEALGPVAIGYALAHEYGHYIQAKFQIKGDTKLLELQADCLAGAILGQNSEAAGIRLADVAAIAQAPMRLASTHGTGDQRSFAVYSGLGQSAELSCSLPDMAKLANNQVRDPRFGSILSLRSGGGVPVTYAPRGPHLRTISGSLGL